MSQVVNAERGADASAGTGGQEHSAPPVGQPHDVPAGCGEEQVIGLRKTSYDTPGRVVEISDVILPGDRTVLFYEKQLERWPA